jgi:hypothetical protein
MLIVRMGSLVEHGNDSVNFNLPNNTQDLVKYNGEECWQIEVGT